MGVHYSSQFKKQYRMLPQKARNQFKKRLALFFEDQTNPQLYMHKLHGKYKNLGSINVTGDIRAIFDSSYTNNVLFVAIGTHNTLYS